MKPDRIANNSVLDKFKRILNVKSVKIVSDSDDGFSIHIKTKDSSFFKIEAIFLQRVYPSLINQLINKHKNSLENLVLIAPFISDRSAELCENNGLNYFDYVGNCYFVYGSIYIHEKGNKNRQIKKQKTPSIFGKNSSVSSLILRELFSDTKKKWKIKYLSEKVNCSIGQVSKVVNYLFENAWMGKDEEGYFLVDITSLLKEWSSVYGKKSQVSYSCYSLDDIPLIEEKIKRLNEAGIDAYLTGIAGGVRYANVVRYNRIHVYIAPEDIDDAIGILDVKEVASGGNLIIMPLDNVSYIKDSRSIDGFKVVSPLQIYLDCMQISSRGIEMAEAIMSKELLNDKR